MMTPQEIVQAQICHRETPLVPFTLNFEDEVGGRLDAYFGGTSWREKLKRYIVDFYIELLDRMTQLTIAIIEYCRTSLPMRS